MLGSFVFVAVVVDAPILGLAVFGGVLSDNWTREVVAVRITCQICRGHAKYSRDQNRAWVGQLVEVVEVVNVHVISSTP